MCGACCVERRSLLAGWLAGWLFDEQQQTRANILELFAGNAFQWCVCVIEPGLIRENCTETMMILNKVIVHVCHLFGN